MSNVSARVWRAGEVVHMAFVENRDVIASLAMPLETASRLCGLIIEALGGNGEEFFALDEANKSREALN
jgi:hypothetical protein